jgi:hypothetical protein
MTHRYEVRLFRKFGFKDAGRYHSEDHLEGLEKVRAREGACSNQEHYLQRYSKVKTMSLGVN